MERIRLPFTAHLEVEFVNRDLALRRVEEWAEKSTYPVQVVFGPEGCGKTAWLRQSAEILREAGYNVIYVDPIKKDFIAYTDLKEFVRKLVEAASEAVGVAALKLASLAIDFGSYALRAGKKRVAILVDDAFQAIGLDKAAIYVKSLLNLIEYPPREYEKIVAVVTTSEGVSRREIGRHRWADLLVLWNMSRNGFEQLYNVLPGSKPSFDEVWAWSGGNPGYLEKLYRVKWNKESVVRTIIEERKLKMFIASLTRDEKMLLGEALDNPDVFLERGRQGVELLEKLIDMNLVMDIPAREEFLWLDTPPPNRDSQLGIGKYVAWQTPLHKEAVEKVLKEFS